MRPLQTEVVFDKTILEGFGDFSGVKPRFDCQVATPVIDLATHCIIDDDDFDLLGRNRRHVNKS